MKIGAERCKNNSTLRKGSAKLPKKYRRSASKFFCILQFDPCMAEINKHPFQMFKPTSSTNQPTKMHWVIIVFTQTPPNSPLPPSFSQESLMRHNTGILQRDKWFVVRTKGPWHKKCRKGQNLKTIGHVESVLFLTSRFAKIEYHRPWGCHSCQSIPVLSKGTESVSYSCLGQIDERWRWTKENKVLKSNDQRRTEKWIC